MSKAQKTKKKNSELTGERANLLPRLFQKDSSGNIRFWEVEVKKNVVYKRYGILGGAVQETFDTVKEGKNIGRSNETSPEEQAHSEAKSAWTKQKKEGYVESAEDAEAGKLDALIEGGIEPMLAKNFEDDSHKIIYPCFVQPKLDGIRCVAMYDGDLKPGQRVSLWTRTRKPIKSCPHVAEALEKLLSSCLEALVKTRQIQKSLMKRIILDGELYNHDLKNDFEKIVSAVRKEESSEAAKKLVQYHIYDFLNGGEDCMDPFSLRADWVRSLAELKKHQKNKEMDSLQFVQTDAADSKVSLESTCAAFQAMGYEGAMARNANARYEFKRSANLQKLKTFQDDEFEILGFEEGRGKLAGHLGSFIVKAKKPANDGDTFNAKLDGATEALKVLWEKRESLIGKYLTIKYQGLTSAGIPRFPVGKAIRDYE
jgi:DNA ligase-1